MFKGHEDKHIFYLCERCAGQAVNMLDFHGRGLEA